jgi:glycosyltransferase involved in cell wall biosynthesis
MTINNPLSGVRVAAIVANNCKADARVIKQAEAIANAGAEVRVFCLYEAGLNATEVINGVTYQRTLLNWQSTSRMLVVSAFKSLTQKDINERRLFILSILCIYVGLFAFAHLIYIFNMLLTTLGIPHNKDKAEAEIDNQETFKHKIVRIYSYVYEHSIRKLFIALFKYAKYDLFERLWCDQLIAFKPDIIHAHDFNTVPAALACAKNTDIKVIFDAHEIEVDREGANHKWATDWTDANIHKHIHKTDALIAVNQSAINFYVERYSLPPELPQCIINNAPVIKQSDSFKDVKKLLELPKDHRVIIYTGGIGINRGVEEIVLALPHLDKVHLCIMGEQSPKIMKEFRLHVNNTGASAQVHFLTPVPHDQVTNTIKTADIGVYMIQPSCLNHFYCLPNKLFEMALSGLALVVSDVPEMAKFVTEEKIGLTSAPKDTMALVHSINQVLDNIDDYKPDAKKLADMRQRWAWPAQETKLLNFYKDILGAHEHEQPHKKSA